MGEPTTRRGDRLELSLEAPEALYPRCGTVLPKMVAGQARRLITTIEPTPQTVYNNRFTNLHTHLGEFPLDATDNEAANQD